MRISLCTFTLAVFLLPVWGAAQALEASISMGAANAGGRSAGTIAIEDPAAGIVEAPVNLGSGFLFAPRLTLNSRKWISHEFAYIFSRANVQIPSSSGPVLDQGMNVGQLMYNILLNATPEGSRIRPFVAAGGGLVSFYPPGFSLFSGVTVNRPGANYGGGVRFRVNEMWHARVDFRQTIAPNPRLFQSQLNSGTFRQNLFSAGVGINF